MNVAIEMAGIAAAEGIANVSLKSVTHIPIQKICIR
jgi:hypothetical protein